LNYCDTSHIPKILRRRFIANQFVTIAYGQQKILSKVAVTMNSQQHKPWMSMLYSQQQKWLHLLELMGTDHVRNSWQERKYKQIQERIYSIQQALQRIERLSFGECIECNQPISLQRLSRLPTAPRCFDCQQKHEQQLPAVSQLK